MRQLVPNNCPKMCWFEQNYNSLLWVLNEMERGCRCWLVCAAAKRRPHQQTLGNCIHNDNDDHVQHDGGDIHDDVGDVCSAATRRRTHQQTLQFSFFNIVINRHNAHNSSYYIYSPPPPPVSAVVSFFQERKILAYFGQLFLAILLQIYALFGALFKWCAGAQKWTKMRYAHIIAAPRPHQQSIPENLLSIFTISNVHNVHNIQCAQCAQYPMYNIQYLHNIQCACFKEWRRKCLRVCTLSKCCNFLLCE